MEFGAVLRELRARQGLSLAELAERTHYSRGHLANVERGIKAPTMELAAACDEALDAGQRLRPLVPERRKPERPGLLRPAQLPAGSSRFVGRARQLQILDEVLAGQDGPMLCVVHGAPGVGKTAVALQWAHRRAHLFPDGQLFVDLHAYGPTSVPADPASVLEGFLVVLGWPSEQIPADIEERARLYRSLMHDRRILVVLDNAASSAQLRPLLPAGPGNAVLITSRVRLEGVVVREGAAELALAPFEPGEALALLREVLGVSRVEHLSHVAMQIARWCGHLPLAVCLAAERIAAHPGFSMDILAADLAEEHARLDALAAGDDDDTAVRAVFSWSYRNLSAINARTFRLLGLHGGPDISLPAAAALCGRTPDEVRPCLEALANCHLVEQTRPGRFRLHDLLHTYAAERVVTDETKEERHESVLRVVAWYLRTARAAERVLVPDCRPLPSHRAETESTPVAFETYREAMDWCETELPNLAAAVEQAVSMGWYDLAWQLPAALFEFFHVRKPWSMWSRAYRAGLAAAQRARDPQGEACMLQGLGIIDLGQQHLDQARDRLEQALALRIELQDDAGEAWSLTGLGQALTELGHQEDALAAIERALTLHAQVGDDQGRAVSLIFLAALWRQRGEPDNALECAERALEISRSLADPHCEGLALHVLSDTCLAAGRVPDALAHLREAVHIRQEAGDRQGEADTLRLLATALERTDAIGDAAACLRQALDIMEDRSDPAVGEVSARLERLLEMANAC